MKYINYSFYQFSKLFSRFGKIKTIAIWIALAIFLHQGTSFTQQSQIVSKPKFLRLTINTSAGGSTKGQLLFVSDSLLLLWTCKDSYDWWRISECVEFFPVRTISQIKINKKPGFWKGFKSGFVIGSIIGGLAAHETGDKGDEGVSMSPQLVTVLEGIFTGISYGLTGGLFFRFVNFNASYSFNGNQKTDNHVLSYLQRHSYSPSYVPLELNDLIKTRLYKTVLSLPSDSLVTSLPKDLEPDNNDNSVVSPPAAIVTEVHDNVFKALISRFHLFISRGWYGTGANDDIYCAFDAPGFSGTEGGEHGYSWKSYPNENNNGWTWKSGLEFNMTSHFRTGASYNTIPYQKIYGMNGSYEHAYGRACQFGLIYITRSDRNLLLSNIVWGVGAGICYGEIKIKGQVSHANQLFDRVGSIIDSDWYSMSFQLEKKRLLGGFVQVSMDYYICKFFSFQLCLAQRFLPDIHIACQTLTFPESIGAAGPMQNMTLREHDINFSGTELTFGTCVHL